MFCRVSSRNFRCNKGTILKESVEYIRQLKKDNGRLLKAEDGYARLTRVNWALSRKLKVFYSMLHEIPHRNACIDNYIELKMNAGRAPLYSNLEIKI